MSHLTDNRNYGIQAVGNVASTEDGLTTALPINHAKPGI